MHRSAGKKKHLMRLLLAAGLAALLVGARQPSTNAERAPLATAVTLSVYTCCGSLSGFADPNPADITSMRAIYGALWQSLYPGLRWKETAFADQATLEAHLAAAVAAGDPPDMAVLQGDYVGLTVLRGLAQPLDAFYAASHIGESYFLPGMARWAHFGGHWWALPAVSGPLGGQSIYLPQYMSPLGYDNHNLITFDDYFKMSEKAVRFDAAGHLTRVGYWPGVDSWETIGTLMCPPGHGLYNRADQPTATDPCNLAYLTYLKKLADLYGGYPTLQRFMAGDPDFLGGNSRAYLATGRTLIPDSGTAYWNLSPLDANTFGVKGGLRYQLTPMPVTAHGSLAEAANYPSTQQEFIVPRGARHAATAFALGKMICWDYGYLLGRAASGSPVVANQNRWLGQLDAGEGALRRQAGLPGNPIAALQGVKMQPTLGLLSTATNPINPVDVYYQQQLLAATTRVLDGQESPSAALFGVQAAVLVQEQRLKAQYGAWTW